MKRLKDEIGILILMLITFRMMSSGKIVVVMYSNSSILDKISFIGLDKDFFSMAHIPTMTWALDDSLSSMEI